MTNNAVSEYWGSLVARYRAGPLPGFLAWWRGELAGLLPQSLKRRLIPPRPVMWLVPDADGALAVWAGGETVEQCDEFGDAEDAALLRTRWQNLINEFRDGEPEVRLCLPAADVLQSPVELPIAVEGNLDQALTYQLDQVTPFSADQVYFDYRIAQRDTEHGRIHIDLRLVPSPRIDALRERLAQIGIRPHAIDCLRPDADEPGGEGFNLLPHAERPRYVYARARMNWLLAGGLAVVLALVMAESIWLRERTVEKLEQEVAVLRSEAQEVMALQRELEDALAAANFLAEHRRQQPAVIRVIDEVTRILPDDIWLQQLQVRGNELLMQGLADGAQRLIGLINDSEMLGEAEFRGTVNIDPSSGRERFNVQAAIDAGRTASAAAAETGE